MHNAIRTLGKASAVFWDFDGVIKDSVNVKTATFVQLFLPYGPKIASRVRHHHENNCGVSRYEKIPLYLEWAGEAASLEQIEKFCRQFSKACIQAVINSPWVPGAREYLLKHHKHQYFVLLTATPQAEIEKILASLQLTHCFQEVFGAPTKKDQAMQSVLERQNLSRSKALMIGDSRFDLLAAQANSVPFLLRCTPLNKHLQASFRGPMFQDFNDESTFGN